MYSFFLILITFSDKISDTYHFFSNSLLISLETLLVKSEVCIIQEFISRQITNLKRKQTEPLPIYGVKFSARQLYINFT